MLIKKIYLENYRSHSNTTIEFSKGVNLILGMNGRGKSSILEAISMIMFNVNDRTGKEKNNKNYIKYGEKTSKVEIDFLANDGREYFLGTIFNENKPKKQMLRDEAGVEYHENIEDKLEELCGIKKAFKKAYENIVIAKQNEFINIFKASARADREKIFNKVFNTEIYDTIYKSLKEAEDKYKREREDLGKDINRLKEYIKDKSQILRDLEIEKNLKDKLEEELIEKNKYSKELEEIIKDYEKKEQEIKILREKWLEKSKHREKNENLLEENKKKKEEAEKAKIIVDKSKDSYFEYLELDKKLKILRTNSKLLSEEKNKNNQYQNDIKIFETKNENLKIEVEKLKNSILKNLGKKKKLEDEIKNSESEEKFLKIKLEEYKKIIEKFESLNLIKENKEKEKLTKITKIQFLEEKLNLKRLEFEKIDINDLEDKLSEFLEIEKELEALNNDKIGIERDIKTLTKSSKDLSGKICPFFNENCENLKGKEVKDYFSDKILKKQEELKVIVENIKIKSDVLSLKNKIENDRKSYFNCKKDIENYENNLKEENIYLKEIDIDIKNQKLEIRDIFKNKEIEDSSMLIKNKTEYEVELKNMNLDEKRANLKILIDDLEIENLKILKNEKLIEENLKNIEESLKKIKNDTEDKIKKVESELERAEKNSEDLKKLYNDYLENNKLANELDLIIKKVEINIKEIVLLKEEEEELVKKGKNLAEEIKVIEGKGFKENYEKVKVELDGINKNLGISGEKIRNYEKDLKETEQKEEEIKNLIIRLKKVENKSHRTNLIKENIKEMGKTISRYMLGDISNSASVNFNKITGRTERIEWSNEDDDKYAVYLVGQERRIAFEQLSGGEQVSVAIAIRGTMTEYFTNSKFMILDEPTNNLDIERKKLLAEYMGEILNNLEQSIIVTHDDTFREMSEKIIEL